MAETKRQRFESRAKALKNERSSWEPLWQDISDNIEPMRTRFHRTEVNRGDKNLRGNIVDNTGTMAARNLASGMMAGITSPARPWFELEVGDEALMEVHAVKVWLDDVAKEMRTAMAQSNIYGTLHQTYYELGTFGTACMVLEEDDEKIFRGIPLTIGQYSLATDQRGIVDTMYREFSMTVRQLVQRFGLEKCSQNVKSLYHNGSLEQWIPVVHLVEPNDERKTGKVDNRNMPFRSVYFEADAKSPELLRESGYGENPLMAPRWDVLGEDTYGTGPGAVALGDTKALQLEQKRKAQAIELYVRPPQVASSTLRTNGASIVPGSINYVDPSEFAQAGMRPVYQVEPRINELQVSLQENQRRISRAFFEDLFLMIAQADGRMTATEVVERREEKMLMLGPVLQRVHYELLDPLINRVFGIMMRNGYFPEPPEELQGHELRVSYLSILAQAQRAIAVGSIERFLGLAGNLAGVNEEVLDNIDFDQAINEYADQTGVPPTLVRPKDVVEDIRRRRQEAIEQQQAAEQMQQGVQAAKLLSETDMREGNALSAMGL
ncbi:portal protein [Halomonas cupida]|uniref:portal protein n=1 Tax=Halomonas cupida TaxID=44933 RepID=UPI003A946699